jgi:hypothetical protein
VRDAPITAIDLGENNVSSILSTSPYSADWGNWTNLERSFLSSPKRGRTGNPLLHGNPLAPWGLAGNLLIYRCRFGKMPKLARRLALARIGVHIVYLITNSTDSQT